MDKSWMALPRAKHPRQYLVGVNSFIGFAMTNANHRGEIPCPCNDCFNTNMHTKNIVTGHLMQHGIMPSYKIWRFHGETDNAHIANESDDGSDHEMAYNDDADRDELSELMEDHYRGTNMGCEWGKSIPNETTDTTQSAVVRNFERMLEAAQREAYPGCKKYTLLAFIVKMLHVKVTCKWTNKSFNMLMEVLTDFLPEGHLIPRSYYEANKFLRDLGMGYENIHVCEKDCVLFWKENASLDSCPTCKRPRYRPNDGKSKKIPCKILRYFPLTPRLRRLYMSRKTAEDMRWHNDKRMDDEILRHPADTEEWKDFDKKYPNFALEHRNVRLGLATDGFMPFSNNNNDYSMWPVMLMPYNLPPWKCMKDPFFMMSLLIPGRKSPGREIDVFMRPLIDELKELWEHGALTYDASSRQTFQMRAAILWTINDFPAYGMVSGWSTKGYLACPICNKDALSQRLRDKIGYIGHRCYLHINHPWRENKAFNGKDETRVKSLELPVDKILEQVNRLPNIKFGKDQNKQNTKIPRLELNWKKKSIFFELPYWKDLKIRHNLDVIHIEKNICDNILGTMLSLDGKNKDKDKARMDLKDMGIRKELHLQKQINGSIFKPPAIYTLTLKERESFYDFLKSIKYPDGYEASISQCVSSKGDKLTGLKSHDCHVLLQRILPIGMHGYVNKDISIALFELGNFFQGLSSRTLQRNDMEKLEKQIVLILCKLEKIFPPAFFDVMVHLAVHLPRDAIIAGPVQYRWMYPIERYLGTLKGYIRNRARPEGSIAEGYINKECLTFCSIYLTGIETIFNREERNIDGGEHGSELSVFKQIVRPFGRMRRALDVSQKELDLAIWFVLHNYSELDPYLQKHIDLLRDRSVPDPYKVQQQEFSNWFKKYMNQLRTQGSPEVSNELWSLANGPNPTVNLYSGCISNGVRFYSRDRDNRRKSQNSGLVVEGSQHGNSHLFYGYLCKVWEMKYMFGHTIVLFQCEWFNTGSKRTIQNHAHFTTIDVRGRWYKNEPFILPNQVQQVFYILDTKYGANWQVVQRIQQRGIWDVPQKDDHGETSNTDTVTETVFQQDEAEVVPIVDIENINYRYCRDDIDPEMIPMPQHNDVDDDSNESNSDSDADHIIS